MYLKNKSESIINSKGGVNSHILLDKSQVKEANMLITWVEVSQQGGQELHSHEAEQAYIIIQGTGIMIIGDEEKCIHEGDIAYVPSNAKHGIRNTGDDRLIYISAATPSFDVNEFYKLKKS